MMMNENNDILAVKYIINTHTMMNDNTMIYTIKHNDKYCIV